MKIIDITKCPDEIINYINELTNKYAELEKLNKELDKSNIVIFSENENLAKEIERLNNIINELEKTLLEWHEYWEDDDSYSWQYKNAYDYLQELKGSDER